MIQTIKSTQPSKEIMEYFDATANRQTRDDLKLAVELVGGTKIAIDCGCGAGSDIAYLHSKGFLVHAFDIEYESIKRCQKRFGDDNNVNLTQATFSSYNYPSASLILADASLFFCPEDEFPAVWGRIGEALQPKGIFVGSFLGSDDTMAKLDFNNKFWPKVLITSEKQIRSWLNGFDTVSLKEHKTIGKTVGGAPHKWHVFSVVAQKKANNIL